MKTLPALAAMAAYVLAACQPRDATLDLPPPPPTPAEHQTGENLFNSRCASCHGMYAYGSTVGPPLVHTVYRPSHHADEAFYRAVEFGVASHHWRFGNMEPVPGLDRATVREIVGYVRWLQRENGIE